VYTVLLLSREKEDMYFALPC